MDLRITYLYRNLSRNPMRTALTSAAIALPIVIYVLSFSVIQGFDDFLERAAKQLRLCVTQKTSIVNPLPTGHRRKIEFLDESKTRILSVCGLRWVGGKVGDKPQLLSTMAADPDTFLDTFSDYKLSEEERANWFRERRAIVVGSGTANQFGWKVGDRVSIKPSLPPYQEMDFIVVAIGSSDNDPVTNFFRADYYEDVMKEFGGPTDKVSFFFVKCATKEDLIHFRTEIDELFARTPDETKTQDEKTFMNSFITQQFNLPRNLTILAFTTIFVAVMAAANTMSMNIRDRMNEIATLRALGFGRVGLFVLVQTESLLLCVGGGMIGAAIPYIAFNFTPLGRINVPLIQTLIVEGSMCAQALLIAAGVAIFAAMVPAISAARTPLVTALRNLE
jgi:putative ABC transport system permease protein